MSRQDFASHNCYTGLSRASSKLVALDMFVARIRCISFDMNIKEKVAVWRILDLAFPLYDYILE